MLFSQGASSSSSTELTPWKHDVFLSFRGEDTRMGFTAHLYDALRRKGINSYRDDEKVPIGKFIRPELLQAIEESKFAVVVLSVNYANSTWCLDELVKIMESVEMRELILVPVFYHVDPSDVRHQRKTFGHAFAKHKEDSEITLEKVNSWRSAFEKVGASAGRHIKGDRDEPEIIDEIVTWISQELQDATPRVVIKGLVGIESRVKELNRLLCIESNDIRFIGISGMSGMGKTTLAEAVYDGLRNQFEGYSFIGNIKDISKESDKELCKLQQKVLVDILKEEIPIGSAIDGKRILQGRLRGIKILLVLDDVNNADQLNYLAEERDWFGSGSRVIITTTNEDLLNRHKVDGRYKCEGLNDDDARRLFNLSAFGKEQPEQGYEKLSNDIVKLADGLPLALNVFGSLLFGKEENYWRDTLGKLQQCPEQRILERLEICYCRLDRNEQEIFMYLSCFLKGRDEGLVKDILKSIGLYPVRGIDILTNRSLITINYDDTVWMHDLLQQMGWEILRKKFPKVPGKRTGLKSRQDIVDIVTSEEEGTAAIEIINQEMYNVEVENCTGKRESFSKMKKLKFLRIRNVFFPDGLDYLSNDLRILEWYGCSLKSLPSTFEPKPLYELDMCCSHIEKLWMKVTALPNLRSIYLNQSKNLTNIPDLISAPNLVKLNLEGCTNLVEVHQSVLVHKRLRYVNLSGCIRLKSLGSQKIEMEGLEALLLSGCSRLGRIPKFGKNMKRLEHLYLDGTKIEKLPQNLGELHSLRKLDVSETNIRELPSSILHLNRLRLLRFHSCRLLLPNKNLLSLNLEMALLSLRELDLSYCSLAAIPDGISSLSGLIELDLSGNDFFMLPASTGRLSYLRMFRLNCCKRLQSLPPLSRMKEDTLYGHMVRFCYYISGEELDVSKFRAWGDSINPTISCLNCPKLVDYQGRRGVADTIVQKYLKVRNNRLEVIPDAIFEIVAAGTEIPKWFKDQGAGNSVSYILYDGSSASQFLQDKWINHQRVGNSVAINFDAWTGLALCIVFVVHHAPINRTDAYPEVKYEIVAHIRVAGKSWKIPIPINFLEAELENQLVWYWTVADDLLRAIDRSEWNQFNISFAVEPEDGNLEVMKFGVRFIHHVKDSLQLKKTKCTDGSTVLESAIRERIIEPIMTTVNSDVTPYLSLYEAACKADPAIQCFDLTLQELTTRVINTLAISMVVDKLDSAVEVCSVSVGSLSEISDSLLKINREACTIMLECKKEILMDRELRDSVWYYYINNSVEILSSWFHLKQCLNGEMRGVVQLKWHFEEERRAGTHNYLKTLQHLKTFTGTGGLSSKRFIKLFQSFCDQQVSYFERLQIMENKLHEKFNSENAWRKVFNVTFAASLSVLLISSVVAATIAAPTVVTAVAASADAVPGGSMGKWVNSIWERYENELEGQKEMISSMQIGTCYSVVVEEGWVSIRVLVKELEMELERMLHYAAFSNREEEEVVVMVDEIMKKLNGVLKTEIEWHEHEKYLCMVHDKISGKESSSIWVILKAISHLILSYHRRS